MSFLLKLDIPDEEQLDFKVSIVDQPAIESSFMTFSKPFQERLKFQEFDKSQKILMGYFMIADLEIPRYDERGVYNVLFPRESIDKIVRNFSKNGLNKNMNEMHKEGQILGNCYVLQHWQINKELGISAPKGFKQEADGSWFGIVRCENEEIYQKALKGEYTGFSVEGLFQEDEIFSKMIDQFFIELEKEFLNK